MEKKKKKGNKKLKIQYTLHVITVGQFRETTEWNKNHIPKLVKIQKGMI